MLRTNYSSLICKWAWAHFHINGRRKAERGEDESSWGGVKRAAKPRSDNKHTTTPPPFFSDGLIKTLSRMVVGGVIWKGGAMRWGLSVKLLCRPWSSSVVAWPRTPLRSFRQLPRTKTAAVLNSSTSKAYTRQTVTAHWSISIQTAPPSPRPPLLNMPQGILAVLMNTSCLCCQTTHGHSRTSNSDEKFMMRYPLMFPTQRGWACHDNNYLTLYCPIVGWVSGVFVPFSCL